MKILARIKTLAVVSVLAFSLPVFAGFDDPREYDTLESQIRDNDLAGVMTSLNKTTKPFVTKKGFLDTPHSSKDYAEMRGVSALSAATGAMPPKIQSCNKAIVEALLSAGAVPNSEHLTSAAELPCDDVIEPLMAKMSDEDISASAKKFFTFMTGQLSLSQETQEYLADKMDKYVKISTMLAKKIASKCPADAVDGPLCEARDAAKSFMKAAQAQDAAEQHANSADGIKEQACEAQNDLREQQAKLNREKEVGRVSGVVNQEILHDAGATIISLKRQIAGLQKAYKAKAKKALNLGSCK